MIPANARKPEIDNSQERGAILAGDVSLVRRRILMAAGGTGGHIFPAITIAEELRSRSERASSGVQGRIQWQIEFAGAGRPVEFQVIPSAGFRLHTIAAAGLKGIGGRRKIRNLAMLPSSFWDGANLLRRFRPHLVAGMGGYIAGPVMVEAALAGIPTVLFESNASPGFTNRALAPFISLAAVGFEQAAAFYGAKGRFTGQPVRAAFYRVPVKHHTPPYTLLVLGGSQGSAAINSAVLDSLTMFKHEAERFRLIHQTGDRDFSRVEAGYREAGFAGDIRPFIEDVPKILEAVDLVISRSGASTVAELAAAGKPSILIPFPAAADDHQLENARIMERASGSRLIEQKELTARILFEAVCSLAQPEILSEMENAARSLSRPEAATRIADLIESLIRR